MKTVLIFVFPLTFLFNTNLNFYRSQAGVLQAKLHGPRVYYGMASYYADKFEGRPTATGELYSHEKLTAACNILPLNTWIRVTNLRNNKSVVVKTNDRMHPRMKRIVDLSKSAAKKLGYVGRGLTQVKVEVLEKQR